MGRDTHTQICRDHLRRIDKYNVVRDYKQADERPRANTHKHERRSRPSAESHGFLHQAKATDQNLHNLTNEENEMSARVPGRQHFVLPLKCDPLLALSPLFYSPRREGRYNLSTSSSGSPSCRFLDALILFPSTGTTILVPSSSARW